MKSDDSKVDSFPSRCASIACRGAYGAGDVSDQFVTRPDDAGVGENDAVDEQLWVGDNWVHQNAA